MQRHETQYSAVFFKYERFCVWQIVVTHGAQLFAPERFRDEVVCLDRGVQPQIKDVVDITRLVLPDHANYLFDVL